MNAYCSCGNETDYACKACRKPTCNACMVAFDDLCIACRLMATEAERDALAAELARLRRLEEAARTMYHANHGSPEWDAAYNTLMEAIDEREEAAREAKKARNA